MTFKPGDRVKTIQQNGGPEIGTYGTVAYVNDWCVGVIFDDWHKGHSLDQGQAPDNRGWNVLVDEIELVSKKTKYNVEDKLKLSYGLYSDCRLGYEHDCDYIKITNVKANGDGTFFYKYSGYKDGSYMTTCSGHSVWFEKGLEYYEQPKVEEATPETFPTENLVGISGTTATDTCLSKDATTIARVGWYDEPVFIPSTRVKPSETTEEYTPIYKTNTKYKPRADNIRKLMGLRNHKSRVAA